MRLDRLFPLLVVLAWLPATARGVEPQFAVVGYLPEYRVESIDAERLRAVTDLVYFGLVPSADGELPSPPVKPDVLRKLHEFKRAADCRLLICVGGAGRSAGFARLATNDAARRRFINSLLAACRSHGFDGVDYDWEHPQDAAETAAYVRLLAETRAAFQKPQLLVTVAQAAWQDLGKPAYAAVDRVHLMSYDHDFPQATLEKSKADVDRLIRWGCPPEKIVLGVPFYGRNRRRRARTYRELISTRRPAADLDQLDGYAFNGRTTIQAKIDLALDRRLGGLMIWELGQDAVNKEQSLLRAIEYDVQAIGRIGRRNDR